MGFYDVIFSVTKAFGPTIHLRGHRGLSLRAKREICFLSSFRKSRFLVATLLGMTEWDDFRPSGARDVLLSVKNRRSTFLFRMRDRNERQGTSVQAEGSVKT